jgi:hypothetical protein
MKQFFGRHIIPFILVVVGIAGLFLMGHLFSNEQVGINPTEFMLKALGKIFYVGIAWFLTHVVIKFFFTTIYRFCHWTYTTGGPTTGTSEFKVKWESYNATGQWDQRITEAIKVHIGIFLAVCLILALAF